MNNLEKERVLKYIEENENSTLYFEEKLYSSIDKDMELEELVYTVLTCMIAYGSLNESGDLDCPRNKNRSSIDIWRHTKFFNPDVTIFEVMDALRSLAMEEKKISSFCCPHISRRIFYLEGNYYVNPDDFDEYRLTLHDWVV